ncbi:MAG: glutathione S-transferase family protein [Alphaproteobacteria bacterium]
MPPDDESVKEMLAQLESPGPPVLYHHRLNLGSQAVRLLLVEKDLAWQSRVLDTATRAEHLMPWYLRLNPAGKLPTLVHRGRTLYTVPAIAAYLDEFIDDDAPRWLDLAATVPATALTYAGLGGPAGLLARRALAKRGALFTDLAERHPALADDYAALAAAHQRLRAMLNDPDALLAPTEAALDKLETHLADGRPYLAGPRFGIADAMWTALLARLRTIGLYRAVVAPRPAVAAYAARMMARPGFVTARIPIRVEARPWLVSWLRANAGLLLLPGLIVFLAGVWLALAG